MKKLIITKKLWGKRCLRNAESGRMCCLGFAANQLLGVDKKAMNSRCFPATLIEYGHLAESSVPRGLKWLIRHADVHEAAHANDELRGKERQSAIKKIFAKHKIKVLFR